MSLAQAIVYCLAAHMVGDYLIQSHWMATEKTKRWLPAALHAITYGLPFLLITQSPAALAVIIGTHAVIDRYRLARHIVWFKNQAAPALHRPAHTATGYPEDTPPWMAVWLMIIADNILHMVINVAAVIWL